MWFKRTGSACELAEKLKREKQLKRYRIESRARGRDMQRLVVGVGQVHPVLQGKFDRFQAKRIGRVQGQIFDLCHFFLQRVGVMSFGQEGFSIESGGVARARLDEQLLQECRRALKETGSEEHFLKKVALEWRSALKRGDSKTAARSATALNAITLLQALNPRVTIFPIEQRDVHGVIGEGIRRLRAEIDRVEASPEYRSVRRKGGKKLTKEEYEAAVRRNKLVKEFNKVLAHPERDRAIFREVLEHAEGQTVTVFVLGQAHRHGFLGLARKHLPPDALFLWITPPGLWWWKAVIRRIGWGLLFVLFVGGIMSLLF